MSNVVKAKLRIARSIKSTLGTRWITGKPVVTTDTGELYVGLGDNIDAVKITDFIQVDSLPLVGLKNKVYIKNDTNQIYIWNGSKFNTLSGNGGSISYATFKALPAIGTTNIIYIVLSDENFYPTSGKSIYIWDITTSKYTLCSRAVAPKSFGSIRVNGVSIAAKNKQDEIKIEVGEGLSITGDPSTNTITIKQTGKVNTAMSKMDYHLDAGDIASLPINLSYTRAEIVNDDVYILGGYNGSIPINAVYKYNITSDTMMAYSTLPSARYFAMSCVYNGNIYLFGGRNASTTGMNDFWMYDVDANNWIQKAPMNIGRFGSFCAVVGDKLWVIGGQSMTTTFTNTIEYYDFVEGQWVLLDSTIVIPTNRSLGATFVFDNTVYCVGGRSDNSGAGTAVVEAFDTVNLTWTIKTPLPAARWGCCGGVYGGLGYIILGSYTSSSVKTVYTYNPINDIWCILNNGLIAKGLFGMVLYNNKFYIFGGNNGTSSPYYNTCSTYAIMSGKMNNYAILNTLKPYDLLVTNTSTGEASRILAFAENDIWQFGSFNSLDASIILTEKQS